MDSNSLLVTVRGERKGQVEALKFSQVYGYTFQRPLLHLIQN